MKNPKKVILLSVVMLLCLGCGNPQKTLKTFTTASLLVAEEEYALQQHLCQQAGQADCPKAEKIAGWIEKGNLFLKLLDTPLDDDWIDTLQSGLDAVIEEMENSGTNPVLIARARQTKILLELCREK